MSSTGASMPVLRESHDTLREGFQSFYHQTAPKHPIEQLKEQSNQASKSRATTLARMYGNHFPQRLMLEQTMVAKCQRLPGIKSEFLGLETLLGKDTDIDYEDFLGNPEEKEEEESVDMHQVMEARLGWAKPHRDF